MKHTFTPEQTKFCSRILVALVIFIVLEIANVGFHIFDNLPHGIWLQFFAFMVPYLIAGYDVLIEAWHGILAREPFNENLLMCIASLGAFALVLFPEAQPHMAEGAAVMLFFQVGEIFEDYAVGSTRTGIAEMMDIAPDYANVLRDGEIVQIDPNEVAVGTIIKVKPGERVPLDGVVQAGCSQVDTSALTGESVPRVVETGSEIFSGWINMTGVLSIRTTKLFNESTVARILDLVENASEKKAHVENFITRFARYYTPAVVICALIIAIAGPLFGAEWTASVRGALIFLVVSCPCALVISVPLSFFAGIGAASRAGILIKGSTYLEALAKADTVAFDKTGTLTDGTFDVVAIHAETDIDPDMLLSLAAHAEAFSDHPIALSVRSAYTGEINPEAVKAFEERGGHGVSARVDDHHVLVGNDKLMIAEHVSYRACSLVGTVLHVALDGEYIGHIVIADIMKDEAIQAMRDLHAAGVEKTVMLTGDRQDVAAAVADKLGIKEVRAQLLPQDKVACVEALLAEQSRQGKVAFVGDGINDAPVLMRADIGIAMGAMGSDAAIEAADIVLMDDKPTNIARSIRIARKTMRIVRQNIVFAIGVKFAIMILALPGIAIANMWLAVFGDVGVACLCILNAMRCLKLPR